MQDLKRWHWVLIGLLLGALLGGSRLYWPPEPLGRNIKQRQFESLLVRKKRDDPTLTKIVVHPQPDGNHIVTGVVAIPGRAPEPDAEIWFFADNPYEPRDTGGRKIAPGGNVVAYLDALRASRWIESYRLAWWDHPVAAMTIWTTGGAILIGGLWPVLLGLMIGAGLGKRPAETEYDLTRFKGEPSSDKPARPAVTEEDLARLAALEANLEAQLGGGRDQSPSPQAAIPAPPRPLENLPLDPAADPASAGPPKDFGADQGDYYPTEVHVHAKEPTTKGGTADERE